LSWTILVLQDDFHLLIDTNDENMKFTSEILISLLTI
jgi:hypothetical protein